MSERIPGGIGRNDVLASTIYGEFSTKSRLILSRSVWFLGLFAASSLSAAPLDADGLEFPIDSDTSAVFVLEPSQIAGELILQPAGSGESLKFLPATMPGIAVAVVPRRAESEIWRITYREGVLTVPSGAIVRAYLEGVDDEYDAYHALNEALKQLNVGTDFGERAGRELLGQTLQRTGVKSDAARHLVYTLAKAHGDAGKTDSAVEILSLIDSNALVSDANLTHSASLARLHEATEDYAKVISLASSAAARFCVEDVLSPVLELDCAKMALMLAGAQLMLASRIQEKDLLISAQESLERLLQRVAVHQSSALLGDTYGLLALAALLSGKLAESEAYYRLELSERLTNRSIHPDQTRSSQINLASVLNRLGQVSEAQRMMRSVLTSSRQTMTAESRLGILFNLALTYQETGDWPQAYRYFDLAQALAEEMGDQFSEHLARFRAGSALRENGNPTAALLIHKQALAFFEIQSPELATRLRVELARDYLALGDIDSAGKSIVDAMKVADRTVSTRYQLDALATATDIAWQRKNFDRVADYVIEFEERFRGTHVLPGVKIDLYLYFLRYFRTIGNDIKASEYAAEALRLVESIRQQYDALAVPKAWTHRTHALVVENLRRLLDPSCADANQCRRRAFEMLERHENYWVRAGRKTRSGNVTVNTSQVAARALRDYQFAEARLVRVADQPDQLAMAMGELDLARERYLDARSGLRTTPDLNFLRSEDIQAALEEDMLVLRFHYDNSTGVLTTFTIAPYLFDAREIHFPTLPQLTRQFVLDRGADQKLAGQLYGMLFGRLDGVEWSKVDRIIMVLPAFLASAPLTALKIPSSEDYLGTRFQIIQTPSITDFLIDATTKPLSEEVADIAILADPLFDGSLGTSSQSEAFRSWSKNLKRLPFTALEAQAIKEQFAKRNVIVATQDAATAKRLMSPAFRNAHVLHIATHGYFSDRTPDVVGLAVSPSAEDGEVGFVSLTRFLTNDIGSRLVIISGCETALGKQYDGAGLGSLTSGVLSRGAGAVIGTLWPIDDRATARFMSHYYEALSHDGGDGAMALRAAQRSMAISRRFRNPKYWAGFVLVAANQSFRKVL
ncbi:MAG: CHAT domain-containing tetratricopeptide repeat protein [Pseudomonadota bacterium]